MTGFTDEEEDDTDIAVGRKQSHLQVNNIHGLKLDRGNILIDYMIL
jgi:hypothetical protein